MSGGEWDVCELCEVGLSSKDLFGERDESESDSENHPHNIFDLLPSSRDAGSAVEQVPEMISKIIFEGKTAFQERMRALCAVYGDEGLFSRTVRPQAAHVPAMRLEVDADKFRQAGSKSRSPRPQSQNKLAEFKRMATELLKLGAIRTGAADTVPQVLLVVEEGMHKSRSCMNYRAPNEATQVPEAWPIPKIILNPGNCKGEREEVQIVEHTIDSTGTHVERKNMDSILGMVKPVTKGEMKTFLGMITYMRSHVGNLLMVEQPLIDLINEGDTKNKRKQVLQWNADAEKAFEDIKIAIDDLPKLYFGDDSLPVYVQTIASCDGIGGYMFQVAPDGSHRPICFISKTLSKAQRKWSVADKNTFAIFYVFKRWEHHLRDRKFVLQTDHINLRYVDFEGTAKVKRWKMLMQEFDFQVEYLEGPLNVVVDSFSRNCANEGEFDADWKQLEIEADYLCFLKDSETESFAGELMNEQDSDTEQCSSRN